MSTMRTRAIFGAVLLVVLLGSCAFCGELSREERDRALREARDLVRTGNRDAAIQMLEALYNSAPSDGDLVKALSGMLIDAGDYERAERILEQYVGRKPNDVSALADLASLYFRSEKAARGMELLDRLVAKAPMEVWPYEIGLDALIDSDMKDDILTFARMARDELGDSTLFAIDIAQVYRDQGAYAKATWEYLLASTGEDMGEEIACEYIMAMARLDEARPEVMRALGRARALRAFEAVVGRAIWEIHLLDGACGQAFEELSDLVKRDRSLGNLLVVFGRRASEVGCYAECGEAYELAAAYTDVESKIQDYFLEKARCELAGGLVDKALATYETVAGRYKDSKWASRALLARAGIYRDLGRLDDAVAEADRIISSRHGDEVKLETILFKGDLLVLTGQIEDAFATYDLVGTDWASRYAQEAFFNLGEISLYQMRFDDAVSYYNVTLREYPDEPRANDAIDRLLLIKGSRMGETYRPELAEFARASLLKRQGKTEEALKAFRKVRDARGEIQLQSLKGISEIHLETGDFESAIKIYKLLGETLDVHVSPSALEAVGDIYLSLGDKEQALRTYEDVILKFPGSVSAGEARRKMELARRSFDDS
jgi:tetratricopeptide (TPR) repeat protein